MKFTRTHLSVRLSSALLCLGLTACGTSVVSTGPVDYGSPKAAETRLDIPPDLSKLPNAQNRYAIPGQVVSASQVGQGQANAGPQLAPTEMGGVTFKREGKLAWISVKQPAEKVWPVVRAFWLDNGFTYVTENAQAGILETDWAENRAKLPQDFIRKALGRVFDALASTGEKDKFRTRIERTEQGVDIFVSHRGIEEVYSSADKISTKWQGRDTDPFLETEFLRQLMVKLGSSPASAQQSIAANQPVKQAHLESRNGQQTLVYQQPVTLGWRHVGLALDRSGFTIQDRDANRGIYFLRYIDPRVKEEPGFFKKMFTKSQKPQFPSEFRIVLSEQSGKTVIQVQNNLGQADASEGASNILNKLLESLQ